MKAFDKNTSMGSAMSEELNLTAGIVSAKEDSDASEFNEAEQTNASE